MAVTLLVIAALATYYVLIGFGVTVGYHRGLAHRSVRLSRIVLHPLVVLGLPAGPPIAWAGNHRFHHDHTDTPDDPHSPVHRGFWYAHCGWYLKMSHPALCMLYALAGPVRPFIDAAIRSFDPDGHCARAGDVAEDPFLRFLNTRPGYALFSLLHVAPFVVAAWLFGWVGVAVMWATGVLMYNAGDAINSVSHIVGTQPFATGDAARNGKVMAVLTLGDGWHNAHHVFPYSARAGLLPWQFDPSWWLIAFLERVGLARDVRVPTAGQVRARLQPQAARPQGAVPEEAA